MLTRHAGGGQRRARHVVLAACSADRKTAADGMRAIIDESRLMAATREAPLLIRSGRNGGNGISPPAHSRETSSFFHNGVRISGNFEGRSPRPSTDRRSQAC